MATYKNVGIVGYEFPGDGTRPAVVVEPGDTVDADTNPNQLYFEWVEGDPPEGAGDFNNPDQPAPEPEPESDPEPEASEPEPSAATAAAPEE